MVVQIGLDKTSADTGSTQLIKVERKPKFSFGNRALRISAWALSNREFKV